MRQHIRELLSGQRQIQQDIHPLSRDGVPRGMQIERIEQRGAHRHRAHHFCEYRLQAWSVEEHYFKASCRCAARVAGEGERLQYPLQTQAGAAVAMVL